LFGRNTEGGALSLVSKAPTGVFGVRAAAGFGNYGGYNVEGHVDLPAIGALKVKLDGIVQHQDPTITNPLAGQIGWNYFDRSGGRLTLQWQPSESFTATLSGDTGLDKNSPFYSQLLNYNPNGCAIGAVSSASACTLPGTAFTSLNGTIKALPGIVQVMGNRRATAADIGVPQVPSVDKTNGGTLHLSWKIDSAVELRSISAYRTVLSNQWDNSGGAHRVPVYAANGTFSRYSLADLGQHQFSQEVQLIGDTGRVQYVAGLYYFKEMAQDDASTPSTNTWDATGSNYTIRDPGCALAGGPSSGAAYSYTCRGLGITNILAGLGVTGVGSIDRASRAWYESRAAYGQVIITPASNDKLHLTLGGRYTSDDKSGMLYIVSNVARPYTYAQKTSRFNPIVTLAYDATPDINLYAKYSTGYRSGGASSRSMTYKQFDPEDAKSYEVGAKTESKDHTVRFNVAAYMMDRKGSQVDFSNVYSDPITNTTRNTLETINAPGITDIHGFEADLTIAPARGMSAGLSYAYTYSNIPQVLNPFTGVQQKVYIVFTPPNAASAFFDYSLPMGMRTLRLHLDANYADATQTFDQYATTNDKSFIVNGRLALANIDLGAGKLEIGLWSRNLLNEAHVYRRDPSNALPGVAPFAAATPLVGSINNILGDYGNYNAPRTVGLEARVKF